MSLFTKPRKNIDKTYLWIMGLIAIITFSFSSPLIIEAQASEESLSDYESNNIEVQNARSSQIARESDLKVDGTGIRAATPRHDHLPSCVTPPDNMVGWWPLDEDTGTTAADLAEYANDGKHKGSPKPINGVVDHALLFDGYNYVEVADHSELDFGKGDFSIDAWVGVTNHSGVQMIVDKRYRNTTAYKDYQGYALYINNGYLGLQLADGDGSSTCSLDPHSSSCTNYGSGAFIGDGHWHLVAVTVDRDDPYGGRFYVDGQLVQTFDPTIRSGSLSNNSPLRMASHSTSESALFYGGLDEVELFKRALTSQEVSDLYNAESAGKCKVEAQPDLKPIKVEFDSYCKATVTYKNVGDGDVTANSTMKGEALHGDKISRNWTLGSLNAGATDTRVWNPGDNRYGKTIRITMDQLNKVAESNEDNNSKDFSVPSRCQNSAKPDLVPVKVDFDNYCKATITYKNVGDGDMTTNSSMKAETPAGGSDNVWTVNATLAAGATKTRSWDFGKGNYDSTIRITMDPSGKVAESDEDNNIKVFSVPTRCQASTPTPTPPPPPEEYPSYLSSSTGGQAGGIAFADEDILAYDSNNDQWSMYFDGSDVGLKTKDVDAFHIMDNGNILFSLDKPHTIAGTKYDDSDIIKFSATSLGYRTKGSFSMYFDGSDVQLTTAAEDINAFSLLSNGDLVISTLGTTKVPGMTAKDEDMLHFHQTQLGNQTKGTWSMYMDGSDLKMTHKNEDIWAAWMDDSSGQMYISTFKGYNISSEGITLKGDGDDIISGSGSFGNNTSCEELYQYWDGDDHNFGNELVDGYSSGPAYTTTTVFSAAVDPDDGVDESSQVDEEPEDDILDDDQYIEQIYLPLINQ